MMKKRYLNLWLLVLACIAVVWPHLALSQTKYEAESAALTGVSVNTSHAGYTGTGYLDGFDNSADKVTFTVNVATAGAYPLVIRYSGPYGEKTQTLQVNGVTQGGGCNVQFPSNANWADKVYGNVNLNAGNNTIAIISCYGWFQVDYITVGSGSTPSLTVSPASLSVGSAAGSSNIAVTSNVSWTAADNQSWITVSPASGSNNGTVAVAVTANTGAARSGTVTIAGGSITRTVTVSQAGATGTLTKYEAESAALTGVTVASGGSGWTGSGYVTGLDNGADRITFTVNASAAGSYPLVLRFANSCGACEKYQFVKVNAGAEVETSFLAATTGWNDKNFGSVSLNAGNNTIEIRSSWGWTEFDYITVGTGGSSNSLEVNPTSLSFGAPAGSNTVAVTSNVSWTTTDNQSWITVSPASGSNNANVTVSVTANTGSASRSGTVTIAGGSITRTVSVTQSGTTAPPAGAMTPGANFWNIEWDGWDNFFASGVNWATTTNPWNPTLISELQTAKIRCLRFMDWNNTNNSCVVTWNQRIPKTVNHYNVDNKVWCMRDDYNGANNTHTLVMNSHQMFGVAYEWQIDLCNRVGADMWINVPMTADDNYITQLATLIRDNLNPSRKVYVEWANEAWNLGFCTGIYAWQRSDALGLTGVDVGAWCDPWRKYTVYASVRTFERFEAVFGANSPRVVKVIGGQAGYHWDGFDYNHMVTGDLAALNNNTINPNHTTFNSYALAPYIGGQSMAAERAAIPGAVQQLLWGKNSLVGTGINMICYEGGADNYPDNNPPLAMMHNAEQEQIYIDYLTAIAPHCNGVFNQYCFYGGTWGLKDYAGEASTSKWRGWLSYWAGFSGRLASDEPTVAAPEESDDPSVRVFPNPVTTGMLTAHIHAEREQEVLISILTPQAQRAVNMQRHLFEGENAVAIPVDQLKNGVHLLVVNKGHERIVKKIVISR